MSKSNSAQSSAMTRQAVAIGIGLFLVLSTVAYIVFPVIFQRQLDSIQHRIQDHAHQGSHGLANLEIDALKERVIALEASVIRMDTSFKVPVSFTIVDSLAN